MGAREVQRKGAQPGRNGRQGEPAGQRLGWQWARRWVLMLRKLGHPTSARPAFVFNSGLEEVTCVCEPFVTASQPCPTPPHTAPREDVGGQCQPLTMLLTLAWPEQRWKVTCWTPSHPQPAPGHRCTHIARSLPWRPAPMALWE